MKCYQKDNISPLNGRGYGHTTVCRRPLQVTVCPMLSDRCPVCLSVCLSVLSVCLHITLMYCGQTVGWIKMSLGTEVGLCSSDIVLDGNPAPPTKRDTVAPTFRPMTIVAKRSPISGTAEVLVNFAI